MKINFSSSYGSTPKVYRLLGNLSMLVGAITGAIAAITHNPEIAATSIGIGTFVRTFVTTLESSKTEEVK